MPFQYYLDKNMVRKTAINPAIANSLIRKSSIRLQRIMRAEINDEESSIVFEDIYESIREAAQAFMQLKGYKPYSHEAVIAFLAEFYNFGEDEITTFNRYRILRNNCVYRAAKVSPHVCGEALEFLETFLPKIRREFDREFSGK